MAQALAPTADGRAASPSAEVMVATPAIRNLIREAKVHQITTAMQSSGDLGMITFDQHLAERYLAGEISQAAPPSSSPTSPTSSARLARL